MDTTYLLTFCRLVLAFLFLISAVSKLKDLAAFKETIIRFQVLAERWAMPAAILVIAGEVLIASLLLLGGAYLMQGFVLATALLLAFNLALLSVIKRNISTTCNCFGPGSEKVSYGSLGRNGFLGFLALAGLYLASYQGPLDVSFTDLVPMIPVALVATILVTQYSTIRTLFAIEG